MFLNNIYSLDPFQIIPQIFIIYEKHCHECFQTTSNIRKFWTLKHEKKKFVTIILVLVNVTTLYDEKLCGIKLDLSIFKKFGCLVFVCMGVYMIWWTQKTIIVL